MYTMDVKGTIGSFKTEGFWSETNKPTILETPSYNNSFLEKFKEINDYITNQEPHFWMNNGLAIRLMNIPVSDINITDYCGYSTCRICGYDCNGSADYVLKSGSVQYTFPQGFLHYVEKHNIKVSEDFVDFIEKFDLKNCTKPLNIPTSQIIAANVKRLMQQQNSISYS